MSCKLFMIWPGLLLLLCSCAAFTPANRNAAELGLPPRYSLYDEEAPDPGPWWTAFNNEEINALIAAALQDNLSLAQVVARMEQARLLAVQAGAARYPAVSISGDASITRRRMHQDPSSNDLDIAAKKLGSLNTLLRGSGAGLSETNSGLQNLIAGLGDAQTRLNALDALFADAGPTSVTTSSESYGLGLSTSYEADLWGRVASTHAAASLEGQAAREDLYAAMLSLSGAVVEQWLAVAAARQETALVDKQLELNRTMLELLELRFRQGMSTALDVLQQRQIVAETESLLPPLAASHQTALNELAVLLGNYPDGGFQIVAEQLPALPDPPPTGVPADLLALRPDVRSAGLALEAADWRVAAARADRLPSLRLGAKAAYGAESWSLLFDNWMTTLSASIAGPIFEGGKRKAEVMRTKAVVEERLARYRLTVLTAVKEVEDAMIRETKQQEYVAALEGQLETARAAHAQALDRYRKGVNTYLPVLSALTSLQSMERVLVRARLNQALYRLHLHLALGGGWMQDEALTLER